MESHLRRKASAQIGHAKFRHEKIRELETTVGEVFGRFLMRSAGKKLRIKNFQHRAAGSRGDHHDFRRAQPLEYGQSHGARLVPVTRVEGGLATAGEVLRTFEFVPEFLENPNHADAGLRIQEIHKTGYEEGDLHLERTRCLPQTPS